MIFVRHPLTNAPEGMCYGRLDVGLSAEAPRQIDAALDALPRCITLVSSPAQRCRILAERISTRDSVAIRYDDRLLEYDFGQWEGMLWQNIPRDQSDLWMQDLWNNAAPDGERYRDQVDRVAAALRDMPPDATIVCHAGVIRAAMIILQNRKFDDVFAEKIPFCQPMHLIREAA